MLYVHIDLNYKEIAQEDFIQCDVSKIINMLRKVCLDSKQII